jgi:hypothetical protein
VLLVADTRVEDPDLWRFAHDSSVHIGVSPTVVADGRSPFEVFRAQRFLVLSPRRHLSKPGLCTGNWCTAPRSGALDLARWPAGAVGEIEGLAEGKAQRSARTATAALFLQQSSRTRDFCWLTLDRMIAGGGDGQRW